MLPGMARLASILDHNSAAVVRTHSHAYEVRGTPLGTWEISAAKNGGPSLPYYVHARHGNLTRQQVLDTFERIVGHVDHIDVVSVRYSAPDFD